MAGGLRGFAARGEKMRVCVLVGGHVAICVVSAAVSMNVGLARPSMLHPRWWTVAVCVLCVLCVHGCALTCVPGVLASVLIVSVRVCVCICVRVCACVCLC